MVTIPLMNNHKKTPKSSLFRRRFSFLASFLYFYSILFLRGLKHGVIDINLVIDNTLASVVLIL